MVVEREARINLTTNVGSTTRAINELAKVMESIGKAGKGAMKDIDAGADEAADGIESIGIAAGKAEPAIRKTGDSGKAAGKKIAAGAKESGMAMNLLGREIDQVKGLLGGLGAVAATKWSINQAEAANKLTKQFQVLSSHEGFGKVKDDFARINELSGGMINNFEAVGAVNRAMAFGIDLSGGKLAKLIELSAKTSKIMGTEMTDSFNDLVTGVSRLSVPILDNLGVVIKLEDVYASYAAQVGKTANALSTKEKQVAVLNKVLETLEENTKNVTASGSALDKMFATGRDIAKDAGDAVNWFAESIDSVSQSVSSGYDKQIDASKKAIDAIKDEMSEKQKSIELTKEEIQVMYDLQGTGLSEGQMDAIAAERVKYRREQEKLLNFELERKKRLTVEQAEAEAFETTLMEEQGVRGVGSLEQGESMQAGKLKTRTGIGADTQRLIEERNAKARRAAAEEVRKADQARKQAADKLKRDRQKEEAERERELREQARREQKDAETAEKEKIKSELEYRKSGLEIKNDLLKMQQDHEKKILEQDIDLIKKKGEEKLKLERKQQEDRERIYQFAGDQITAIGSNTIDALINDEAERLPYLIANQAYTSGKQIFFDGLRTFLFGADQNAILPGLGATAVTQGLASMGVGASLTAAGAIGMVAFPDPVQEAKQAGKDDNEQKKREREERAAAGKTGDTRELLARQRTALVGPITLFPDQTSMYNVFASQGFVINQ